MYREVRILFSIAKADLCSGTVLLPLQEQLIVRLMLNSRALEGIRV
jgi:hypothetical protein